MQEVLRKIEIVNHILMDNKFPVNDIGLLHGKMGVSIYFFHLAQATKDVKYQEFAEKLIMGLYEEVGKKHIPMDFEYGLTGIGCGLIYLIKKGFVEANIDDILSNVDDEIYKYMVAHKEKLLINVKRGTLGYILYFLSRLQDKDLIGEDANTFVLRRMLVDLVNRTSDLIEESKLSSTPPILFDVFWDLPISLIILSRIRAMNIYNDKIDRILEHLSPVVLSTYPSLSSNKLYLLLGLESVLQEKEMPLWRKHADLLERDIRLIDVVQNELKDKNIHFMDGLTGVYFISKYLYSIIGNKHLLFQKDDLVNKIVSSEYWDEIDGNIQSRRGIIGIAYGLTGVGMFLLELVLNKNSHKELIQGSLKT